MTESCREFLLAMAAMLIGDGTQAESDNEIRMLLTLCASSKLYQKSYQYKIQAMKHITKSITSPKGTMEAAKGV